MKDKHFVFKYTSSPYVTHWLAYKNVCFFVLKSESPPYMKTICNICNLDNQQICNAHSLNFLYINRKFVILNYFEEQRFSEQNLQPICKCCQRKGFEKNFQLFVDKTILFWLNSKISLNCVSIRYFPWFSCHS